MTNRWRNSNTSQTYICLPQWRDTSEAERHSDVCVYVCRVWVWVWVWVCRRVRARGACVCVRRRECLHGTLLTLTLNPSVHAWNCCDMHEQSWTFECPGRRISSITSKGSNRCCGYHKLCTATSLVRSRSVFIHCCHLSFSQRRTEISWS